MAPRAPYQDAFGRWYLTRWADVTAVLKHPDTRVDQTLHRQIDRLRKALGKDYPGLRDLCGLLLFANGPCHRELRGEAAKTIRKDKLDQAARGVFAHFEALACAGDELDGVTDIVNPCIDVWRAAVLGISQAQSREIAQLADQMMARMSRGLSDGGPRPLEQAVTRFHDAYLSAMATRTHPTPEPSFAHAGLYFSAMETLGGFCTNILLLLSQNPLLQDRLRQDPTAMPLFLVEAERYCANVRFLAREIGAGCVDLTDTRPTPDTRVVLDLCAATRDPSVWDRPDTFDLTRPPLPNLAFSADAHRCLGIQATRRFVPTFLTALLTQYTLSRGTTEPRWTENLVLHQPVSLPLRITRVA